MGTRRIWLLWALIACRGVSAQEEPEATFGVEADLGYGETDNLTRAAADEIESGFQILGLAFDMRTQTTRFFGALEGDMELRKYAVEDALPDGDDEVLGSLDGTATMQIMPERVRWDFAVNTGQARPNPLDAIGPLNREQVRVFTHGPGIDLPFGERNTLSFAATRSDREYNESDNLDSVSMDVDVAIQRAISTVAQVGLELGRSEIDYDLDVPTYDFKTFYLTYQKRFTTGGIEVRIGTGEVETAGETNSTPLVRFVWDRRVGDRSGLNIWVTHELTDPGALFRGGGRPGLGLLDDFGTGGEINDSRLQDVALGNDPLERTTVGFGFDIDGRETDFFVSAGASRDEFQGENLLANDGEFLQVSLSRDFGRFWNANIGAWVRRQEFQNADRNSDDISKTLLVSRLLGARASLELAFQRNTRESNVDPSEESVYVATINYALLR